MRTRAVISFALGCLAAPTAVAQPAPSPTPPAPPEVRTRATVERGVRPDLATVFFLFTATGRTPAEAGRRVDARADSLRRGLQALGIPRDSLVSGSRWQSWRGRIEAMQGPVRYIVRPGAETLPPVPVQDSIYRAHDAIEVRIRDLTKVGPAIDTALAHGITDIPPIRFTATDASAAYEDALREATRRARQQAEAIAAGGGVRLGRTLSLGTEGDPEYDRYRGWELSLSASASRENPGTDVVHPRIPVRAVVYGRWELIGTP